MNSLAPRLGLAALKKLHCSSPEVFKSSSNFILCGRLQFAYKDNLLSKHTTSIKYGCFVSNCSQGNEMDLTMKKCVPCNSKDLKPMSTEVAEELLKKVPEWSITNVDGKLKLHRSWKTKNFTKAIEFFKHIGDIAEAEGHHPDLHLVKWNDVSIDIWTHSIGGLTENDFILAAKISSFDAEPYLKKKTARQSSTSSS